MNKPAELEKTQISKAEKYKKIRQTILERYGPDYYKKLGARGGKSGDNRPFRDNPELAKKAARRSAIVRRQNSKKKQAGKHQD